MARLRTQARVWLRKHFENDSRGDVFKLRLSGLAPSELQTELGIGDTMSNDFPGVSRIAVQRTQHGMVQGRVAPVLRDVAFDPAFDDAVDLETARALVHVEVDGRACYADDFLYQRRQIRERSTCLASEGFNQGALLSIAGALVDNDGKPHVGVENIVAVIAEESEVETRDVNPVNLAAVEVIHPAESATVVIGVFAYGTRTQ